MLQALWEKLKEAIRAVGPVTGIILIAAFLPEANFSLTEIGWFLLCALLLILGIALFNLGADIAMTPMGQMVGTGLTRSGRLSVLLGAAFFMGLCITIAEPDLSVLAAQVSAVMNSKVLIISVGSGVGLFLLLAVLKIIYHKDLTPILLFFYAVLFALAALLLEKGKEVFLPLSFDSGGVTTGPITVPFIMALGVGAAGVIGGRDAGENSFGLIALCSVGPMLAVSVLSLTSRGELVYELSDYSIDPSSFGAILWVTSREVLLALGLVVILFLLLDAFVLKYPLGNFRSIWLGIIYTFTGLVLFLSSASAGFLPFGFRLGTAFGEHGSRALTVLFAFVIGAVVVLAEPAVHVLNKQVEEITGGSVSRRSMQIALSAGVGLSIGLSVIRILNGFSLLYYLIPGYLLSLGLSFFVPRIYTAIAFDSGGVASGPLTSSFILPFAIGICSYVCGDDAVLSLGFGIVAMVAMTPLITIQLLGFEALLKRRIRHARIMNRLMDEGDGQIINFAQKEERQ